MKTISMPWGDYQDDLNNAETGGELRGRQFLRRELGPVLDELMNITRIRSDTGTWSLDYPGSKLSNEYRKTLRKLMIESGLIKEV